MISIYLINFSPLMSFFFPLYAAMNLILENNT